jgi:outer membrane protein TolC
VRNVDVARRRSRLASLEQKAGQASARDVLTAEESLRQAMDGLTGSLVSYETTRLNFLGSLGLLEVTPDGKVYERDEPYQRTGGADSADSQPASQPAP